MKLLFLPRVLLTAAALALATSVAHAVSFDITVTNANLGTPPYGTVTLTQVGANVNFVVDLAGTNAFVKTGSVDFQAFLFSGTGVALGDIVVAAHNPALVASTGPFTASGLGTYGFGINAPSANNGGAGAFTDNIVFTVNNAVIADFTTPNAAGYIFAADILGNGFTGPAAVPVPGTGVPDGGSTLALLGLALGVLALIRRKMS